MQKFIEEEFVNKLTPTSKEIEWLQNDVINAIINDEKYQNILVNNYHMWSYLKELEKRNDSPSLVKYIKNRISSKTFFNHKSWVDKRETQKINELLNIDIYNILLGRTERITKKYYLELLTELAKRKGSISNIYSLALNLR